MKIVHTHLQNQFTPITALLALALLTGACSSNPPPRPVATDPSNANAAQSPALTPPMQPEPTERTEAAKVTEPAKVAEPAKAPGDAPLYRCPMHPEVTAATPGKCPKCGMTLQLQKPTKSP